MWNSPLLRILRREMGVERATERCRASCAVLLGQGPRGLPLLERPDRDLSEPARLNRQLLIEEIRQREQVLTASPLEVAVGVAARCNIRCGFCTGPSGDYGELGERRMAELEPWLPTLLSLVVSGPGEPLMSRSFRTLLARLGQGRHRSLSVSLTTNGTLMVPAFLRAHAGVSWGHIRVSLNAGSEQSHHRLTGRNLFHRILRNIEAIADMRASTHAGLRLTISCVVSEAVLGELRAFAEIVDRFGADTVLEPMTGDLGGLSPFKSAERLRVMADECRGVADEFRTRNPALERAFRAVAELGEARLQAGIVEPLAAR
jgi:molybdenum cofactor biosynthesis enzyme MoaA